MHGSGELAILNWTSYEKIAEVAEQWQLDEADFRALEKIRWVVTEKIHGANFCIITDGVTISVASRKRLLAPDEEFFQHRRVLPRLESRIYQLFGLVKKHYPGLSELSIYGELFGGAYPHPDVPPVASLQPIQTGIYYTPEIDFCVFDLAISGERFPRAYLDYDRAIALFQATDLFYAHPLFTGSYREALNYPIEFSSTIPAQLGLPPLAQANKAEGVVIKPLKALVVSAKKGPLRPILKRKIAEFAEDRRFHQAQKWSSVSSFPGVNNVDLLKWEALNQLTENRLQSAISKIGYRSGRVPSKSRQLFQLFLADILEQVDSNLPNLFAALTGTEKAQLIDAIQQEVRIFLKRYFQQEKRRV
jgi:Rnl2 family RNA ligase